MPGREGHSQSGARDSAGGCARQRGNEVGGQEETQEKMGEAEVEAGGEGEREQQRENKVEGGRHRQTL